MTTGYRFLDVSNDSRQECPICSRMMKNKKTLDKCKHSFCKNCIEEAFQHSKKCPLCSQVYGDLIGNQPNGIMTFRTKSSHLPGYPECGTITISYVFHNGTQGPNHPNPGTPYTGTRRTAFLPENQEGRKVLTIFQTALERKITCNI